MNTTPSIFTPKMQQLGRIRIGNKVEGKRKDGTTYTRPNKLDTFRITSHNPVLLKAVSESYGGEVVEWHDAPEGRQWEVITETQYLPVAIPPSEVLTQCYEQWIGGACFCRCDGQTITFCADEKQTGQPCHCPPDHEERSKLAAQGKACGPVSRLNVFLPDIPALGVWRIDTGGYYSGSELPGIVPFLEQASAAGQFLNCTLGLETRTRRRIKELDANGKPKYETRTFPVITLQPADVTFTQLLTGNIPEQALLAPAAPQRPQIEMTASEASENLFGEASPSLEPDEKDRADICQRLKNQIRNDLVSLQLKPEVLTGIYDALDIDVDYDQLTDPDLLAALSKAIQQVDTEVAATTLSPKELKAFWAQARPLMTEHDVTDEQLKTYMNIQWGISSSKELTPETAALALEWIDRSGGPLQADEPEVPTHDVAGQEDEAITQTRNEVIRAMISREVSEKQMKDLIKQCGGNVARIDYVTDISVLDKLKAELVAQES